MYIIKVYLSVGLVFAWRRFVSVDNDEEAGWIELRSHGFDRIDKIVLLEVNIEHHYIYGIRVAFCRQSANGNARLQKNGGCFAQLARNDRKLLLYWFLRNLHQAFPHKHYLLIRILTDIILTHIFVLSWKNLIGKYSMNVNL